MWESEQDTHIFLNEIKAIIDSDIDPVANEENKISLVDTDIPLPNAPLELEIPSGTLSLQSANFATDLVSKIETGATTKVIDQNTAVTLTSAADSATGNGVMYFNIMYRTLEVGSSF